MLDLFRFLLELAFNSLETKGIIVFGIAFKCSLKSSVSPPKPIDVKKLMANLVFCGLSRGKSPSKASCNVVSLILRLSFTKPIDSANT